MDSIKVHTLILLLTGVYSLKQSVPETGGLRQAGTV